MGFWYKSSGLIERIIPEEENDKIIRWLFIFNKSKIKSDKIKEIKVSYAFSLPGMFPIKDGKLYMDEVPCGNYKFNSSLKVAHKIRKIVYIIALEEGIKTMQHPKFSIKSESVSCPDKFITCADKSDIFYKRFVAVVRNPVIGSSIQVSWDVEH